MKKLIAVVLILAASLAAQEKRWQQRVFDVKYADVVALERLLAGVIRDARIVPNPTLKAISVGTFDESSIQVAAELIKRYDVPQATIPSGSRNVALTGFILVAAPKGAAGDAVPADLDPVVKQLRAAFGYSDFRLLESFVARGREGRALEISGIASASQPGMDETGAPYQVRAKDVAITPSDKGSIIRLTDLRFSMRVPVRMVTDKEGRTYPQFNDVVFSTDLDIHEIQKVVVGKARGDSSAGAYVLVLTAKAVD